MADEDAVGRLVRLDRDALGEHVLAHGDHLLVLGQLERRVGAVCAGRRAQGRVRGTRAYNRRILRDAADDGRRPDGRGPSGRNAENALEGLGDLFGVGVGEPDGLFLQRTARLGLGDGRVRLELLVGRLGLLEFSVRALGANLGLRPDLRLLHARLRFALLGQLLDGDDPDDAPAVEPLEPARLEDRVERLLPGDIVQRHGHLALDILAGHDIAPALRGQDA